VDVPVSILDHSLATHELGWQPAVNLEQGLVQTLEWMRRHRGGQAVC
jgi:nucleoside-diphosphate-sugar epimerase